MAYRDNVNALAEKMGISNNPRLREEDLDIAKLLFCDNAGNELTAIEATPMNCGGRLFFQRESHFPATTAHHEVRACTLELEDIRPRAQEYFAELWEPNPEPGKRALLDAIRDPRHIQVVIWWKEHVHL